MNKILVTVITINRNMGDRPSRTIASLSAQTEPFIWVVIDGGSRDHSVELLRAALRPGDQFISEPDEGIVDAFNKGLAQVTSGAVVFLNAGDAFADSESLARLSSAWRAGHSWVTSGAMVMNESGRHLYSRDHGSGTSVRALLQYGCRIWHAATLVDRSLFEYHGRFDSSFRISMDYEFWLRLAAAGHSPWIIPGTICQFYVGGASSRLDLRLQEDRRARESHDFKLSTWQEWKLSTIAMLKHYLRYVAGPVFYRIKERLRW
jgi:glycosyltransferase involved in cell wall biosynthesis